MYSISFHINNFFLKLVFSVQILREKSRAVKIKELSINNGINLCIIEFDQIQRETNHFFINV